jgi:hypothetical protein
MDPRDKPEDDSSGDHGEEGKIARPRRLVRSRMTGREARAYVLPLGPGSALRFGRDDNRGVLHFSIGQRFRLALHPTPDPPPSRGGESECLFTLASVLAESSLSTASLRSCSLAPLAERGNDANTRHPRAGGDPSKQLEVSVLSAWLDPGFAVMTMGRSALSPSVMPTEVGLHAKSPHA